MITCLSSFSRMRIVFLFIGFHARVSLITCPPFCKIEICLFISYSTAWLRALILPMFFNSVRTPKGALGLLTETFASTLKAPSINAKQSIYF